MNTTRRHFLTNSTLTTAAFLAAPPLPAADRKPTGKIAALITEYRNTSHADVIVGRLIKGLNLDLEPQAPPLKIGAMFVDQTPGADLSRPLSKRFAIPIAKTVRDAILDADGNLAVDGVVIIGEHGNYPRNERGQHLYPRRRFFEETVAAFEEAGAVVPVFNDKHLAPLWSDAKWIYDKAVELQIPFMAGSSLPVTWRRPWLEIPLGTPVDEALAVGFGGLESYGFHALETLQCMVERRQGGASGVAAVQCLEGDAVWQAMADGRFSRDLLAAALSRNSPPVDGDFESRCQNPAAYLIEYTDGFRATCLMLNGLAKQFLFAAKLTGDTGFASTQFWLQEPVYGHFSYLTNAIAQFIQSGHAPYPVERTLLTTGILATAMASRFPRRPRRLLPRFARRSSSPRASLSLGQPPRPPRPPTSGRTRASTPRTPCWRVA
ncbi:MAG: hypothetical protein P8J87_08630 [Verrucomicrobiales bacterium]|nr:hypothetical protein [Verrucomicrobiales bacterium]